MTRHLLPIALIVAVAVAGLPAAAQRTIYLSPDVPTEPDVANLPPNFFPWEVIEHAHLAPVPFGLEFSVPGDPAVDAIHKMDAPGFWLFSVEAPNDIAGAIAPEAQPRDVIIADVPNGLYSLFFDGDCVTGAVPLESTIDALYLDGDDHGGLIVSFDVPTTIGSVTFQPSELVRYRRIANNPCGWVLLGSEIDFAFVGGYFPMETNVTGADKVGGNWLLSLDVPVDVAPPFGPTRTPGQIVTTDGVTWDHFFDDLQAEGVGGWPISSVVDALSCQSNPGKIDSPTDQIYMNKSLPDIVILCPGSCSSGADRYGFYEGTIASIRTGTYDHTQLLCDRVCAGSNTFTPGSGSTYYLVVPNNFKEEGSYGTRSNGSERPQAALVPDRCTPVQTLTACP